MEKEAALRDLVESPLSRRRFAQGAIAAGLLAATGGLMGSEAVFAQGLTDVDILNFALNLEYLEAEFYTIVTTGKRLADIGIATSGTGSSGATVGGGIVPIDSRTSTVAAHITVDEQAHVTFLRSALGSAAVAKPAINLEALGIGFRSQNEFIALARAFEDVGVSAYGGAAPLISSRSILASAVGVGLTEAQHAGVLRLLIRDANIPVPQLDGLDVPPLGSPAGRFFQVENRGLSTVRTASQVLAIVYGSTAAGTSSGAFFPSGFNGTIHTV